MIRSAPIRSLGGAPAATHPATGLGSGAAQAVEVGAEAAEEGISSEIAFDLVSFEPMERLDSPPAHAVAQTIAQHFRRHVERAGISSEVPPPDAVTIERIINAAFWASL